MRRNYTAELSALAGLTLLSLAACRQPAGQQPATTGHHQVLVIDSSLTALTQPVNQQVLTSIPAIRASSGTRIISTRVNGIIGYDTRNRTSLSSRVSGRIEKLLIKYNYQPVKKGQLILELYSPDLAAAQRELLYVAANSPALLPSARQRLLLLGMTNQQVDRILRTGEILYRVPVYSNSDGYILETQAAAPAPAPAAPATGGEGMGSMGSSSPPPMASVPAASNTPLLLREGQYVNAGQSLFTIYQAGRLVAEFALPPALTPQLKKGQSFLFYTDGNPESLQSAGIGLIEPLYRNGQQFGMLRAYLDKSDYRPGQLLTGIIPVVVPNSQWLPKAAVWRSGSTAVVFRKGVNGYMPMPVQTGVEADGYLQIKTPINGWEVAANAAYLVDSESFIPVTDKQ
ncbi:MAG: efflux RND transporter periplasmic adaptor subunit [Candidatus Pseudobacter hemicellulosilyticus]|uniref:Efflux RND transporter periplasmic adaptor subunit n=1 Tax=Candidatus Pseudobacter hemicellulosilyticus TaxID=3121375 RepID=A0AAJ5WSE8_9BACT|nr:MAG: efflux RND transporter periplasmic adaptor subunit [Pseudobacter sp.]